MRRWIIGFILALLGASADAAMVCNKAPCRWRWEDPGLASLAVEPANATYRVEIEVPGQPTLFQDVVGNVVALDPPDRTATTTIRLRVRRLEPVATDWSGWSEYAYGVPVGWDPDWDQDGFVFPSDFESWMRAFSEPLIWPRHPAPPEDMEPVVQ